MTNPTQHTPVFWREGTLVNLGPLTKEHLPLNQTWINDPRVNQFLIVSWPLTMEAEEAWYEQIAKDPQNNIQVLIYARDTGEPIGTMDLRINTLNQVGSTGALIGDPAYHGRGYGTEAKMLLLEYAFNWRGLHSVTSRVLACNGRSARYNERCGYREVGRLTGVHIRDGERCDEIIMQVMADEWRTTWEEYKKAREVS